MNQTVYHPTKEYFHNRDARLALNAKDKKLWNASGAFLKEIVRTNYSSNFSWLGRPIIQIPQDMFALQEIIWSMKPDFIVETGIAHGGSIIFYASMLELIGKGTVIGIDIDIRKPNREEIEKHSLFRRIEMIEGSSISSEVVEKVKAKIGDAKKVLVCLDSNHTHEHVLKELELYTPFIKKGGYCVVFDTGIEDVPPNETSGKRPWGPGNNPKTAVWEFLKNNDRFKIDKDIDTKLLISAASDGYLHCIKDY